MTESLFHFCKRVLINFLHDNHFKYPPFLKWCNITVQHHQENTLFAFGKGFGVVSLSKQLMRSFLVLVLWCSGTASAATAILLVLAGVMMQAPSHGASLLGGFEHSSFGVILTALATWQFCVCFLLFDGDNDDECLFDFFFLVLLPWLFFPISVVLRF